MVSVHVESWDRDRPISHAGEKLLIQKKRFDGTLSLEHRGFKLLVGRHLADGVPAQTFQWHDGVRVRRVEDLDSPKPS